MIPFLVTNVVYYVVLAKTIPCIVKHVINFVTAFIFVKIYSTKKGIIRELVLPPAMH